MNKAVIFLILTALFVGCVAWMTPSDDDMRRNEMFRHCEAAARATTGGSCVDAMEGR